MSRTPIFADNKSIARKLIAFVAGETLSYDHTRRLLDLGHIEVKAKVKTDAIAEAGRGRHKNVYDLSSKGKRIVALSKGWKL